MFRACRKSRKRKKFTELSRARQITLLTLSAIQIGLLLAAEVDIQRRSAAQVRGRKRWWRAICLINFVGPLSYFQWGRAKAGG